MALTGHLSDLSLSELIEFFCNQRKTGRLKVLYPQGPGYFQLQTGSVVDAKIGMLRGIDAVYYALTLPNAAFEFSGATEAAERTINQPWTQVVLEGLRRLDEGMIPPEAFPEGFDAEGSDGLHANNSKAASSALAVHVSHIPSFLSLMNRESMGQRKPLIAGAAAVAVLLSVAAIGVPAGWYGSHQPSLAAGQPNSPAPGVSPATGVNDSPTAKSGSATDPHVTDAALAAKRRREKERAKAREEKINTAASESPKPTVSPAPQSASSGGPGRSGPKRVTVQVTYDESGRVVQASGADPTAIRIARQKRFPAGKAGTATITIPIN
jgi:hypothetical protein